MAEVALGSFIFAIFSLAVLALLVRCNQLNGQDKSLSQVVSLSEGLMEELVMQARTESGFLNLGSQSLHPAQDPDYLYSVDVSPLSNGLKKITLLLYYRDPPDRLATCLGTAVEQP